MVSGFGDGRYRLRVEQPRVERHSFQHRNRQGGQNQYDCAEERSVDVREGDLEGTTQGEDPDDERHGRGNGVERPGRRFIPEHDECWPVEDVEGRQYQNREEYNPVKGDLVAAQLLFQNPVQEHVRRDERPRNVPDNFLDVRDFAGVWRHDFVLVGTIRVADTSARNRRFHVNTLD